MLQEFETELKNAADDTSEQLDEKVDNLKDDIRKWGSPHFLMPGEIDSIGTTRASV